MIKTEKAVLVVEDNAAIRELIRFLLEKEGYTVHVADNGRDALNLAEQLHPDLIMMDVAMRPPDGFETCRSLKRREKTRDIPVMLVSANGQKREQDEGINAGAVAYMIKPFDPEFLLKMVKDVLQSE